MRRYYGKMYKIYIFEQDKFELANISYMISQVKLFIDSRNLRFKFIKVDNFTVTPDEEKLIHSSIYLGGELVYRKYDILPQDIEELKKTLTTVYRINGNVNYYPNIALSCQDVRSMLNIPEDEWFRIIGVKELPDRWAIITYDWWQHTDRVLKKRKNKIASAALGMDVYGDVLYINENLIS